MKFRHLQWSVFLICALIGLASAVYNFRFSDLFGGVILGIICVIPFTIFGWPIYRIFANMFRNEE